MKIAYPGEVKGVSVNGFEVSIVLQQQVEVIEFALQLR